MLSEGALSGVFKLRAFTFSASCVNVLNDTMSLLYKFTDLNEPRKCNVHLKHLFNNRHKLVGREQNHLSNLETADEVLVAVPFLRAVGKCSSCSSCNKYKNKAIASKDH